MLFKELFNTWKEYPNHWDTSYKTSLDSGIWVKPDGNIEEKLLFLNKWLCRIDIKTALPSLKTNSADFSRLIHELKNTNISSLNFERQELRSIYSVLNKVDGMGPTGISKYLHMHKPDLFVMWDNQIFRDYFNINTVTKATATPDRYIKFLKGMKGELIEAIKDYSNLKELNEIQIVNFQKEFNNETLLRIVDKYNYVNRGKYRQNSL
jgi:hypothetical protein